MDKPDMQEAVRRVRELPTLPSVLGKVLTTAADPESSALDLGEHIAADQSLSATLLKIVNSAYYGYYRQIKSVSQAIVMLGFLEVRNLALTATAFRTLGEASSDYDRLQLWRHALGSAMAAEGLARGLALPLEGVFESALLHDIGKVVFDMLYPEQFREAAHRAHERQCHVFETEKEIFGMDHAEAGGLLAEYWRLPLSVVEAIGCHHAPDAAAIEPQLAHLTSLANSITYEADLGELSNGRAPAPASGSCEYLGCGDELCAKVRDMLRENADYIEEILGALSSAA